MSLFQGFTNANAATSYFELKGAASNWSTYPATTDVNLNNNSLVGACNVVASNVNVSNVSAGTLAVSNFVASSVSGVTVITFLNGGGKITADASDLFFNGVELANSGDISNVDAWATYAASTNVNMNGNNLEEVDTITGESNLNLTAPLNINMETLFGSVNIRGDTDLNIQLKAGPSNLVGAPVEYLNIDSDQNIRLSAVGVVEISGASLFLANVDVCGSRITNLGNPVDPTDAVSKQYVDSAGGSFLSLAGGTMSGAINMDGNDISNVGSLFASGVTDSVELGSLTNPMLNYTCRATNVNIQHLDPIQPMFLQSVGNMRIQATTGDLDIVGDDVNISTTGTTNILNLTSLAAIQLTAGGAANVTAGGAFAVQAGGLISIVTPGNIEIGSGNVLGASTSIEKFDFAENIMSKSGLDDIEIQDVSLITNQNGGVTITASGGNLDLASTNIINVNSLIQVNQDIGIFNSILDSTSNIGISGQVLTCISGSKVQWLPPAVAPHINSVGEFTQQATGTTVLTPSLTGITYLYTSGTIQNFDSTQLIPADAGWYCYVKNCSNANISVQENGNPIAGNTDTLFPTVTGLSSPGNSSFCLVLWNGTSLKLF